MKKFLLSIILLLTVSFPAGAQITLNHSSANINTAHSTALAITDTGSGQIITATERGQWGSHLTNTSNPHHVTAAQVGLGNVDNTSDADKPVSTATQTALDAKEDALSSCSDGQVKKWNAGSSQWECGTDATGGTGSTNLGYTASPTDGTVTSSSGTDATVPAADGTNAGLMLPAEKSKLFGVEENATADQTGAEIKTAYENEADTNAYTDAEKSKLNGIEVNAKDDQNASEVPFTPNGSIEATDVQAAIQEVRDEAGSGSQATETAAGIAEIATNAEVDAATDDQRFITPLKLEHAFGSGKAFNLNSDENNLKWATGTTYKAHLDGIYEPVFTKNTGFNKAFGTTSGTVAEGNHTHSDLAPLASPTFTGDPKAPTPSANDNDTSVATTAYVRSSLSKGEQENIVSVTIEDPGASEDVTVNFVNRATTITECRAVLVGSSTPSVTWTIRHGTDRSATGAEVVTSGTTTTSTTSGSDVTTFNDATIVADSFVWLETTAQSGTVTELHVTCIGSAD